MTFINSPCDEIKTYTIRPGNPDFNITGKYTISRRASIEISSKCPKSIALLIADAMERGYIVPVATITEREKIFMSLANE